MIHKHKNNIHEHDTHVNQPTHYTPVPQIAKVIKTVMTVTVMVRSKADGQI